jgi:hypothetical protein
VSFKLSFQILLAFLAVKGLIGIFETKLASFSENKIFNILLSNLDGGAPCGNLFNRSTKLL